MYLPVPLVLALTCLFSLAPPVAASFLHRGSHSRYVRHHDIYARSPYAKQWVDPPIRPGTPYPRETPVTPTRASVGRPGPTGTYTGGRRTHRLHCSHNQAGWNPFHNPAVGPVCGDFVGCEGAELRQLLGTPDRGMLDMCKEVCSCRPLDDHVIEMEQMGRGTARMRTQHSRQ